MGRAHALAISVLLTIAAVGGAYATTKTLHVGESASEPVVAPSGVVAKRKAKLDRWQRSLNQAKAKKPPKLPSVPKYPKVKIPTASAIPIAQSVVASSPVQTAPASAPSTTPGTKQKVVYRRPKPITRVVRPQPVERERSEEETKRLKAEVKARTAPLKAEIEQLEGQIKQLKTQEQQIRAQLEPLKQQAEQLEGEAKRQFKAQRIDPLEAQIESLKAQEEQLKKRIEALHAQIEQIWHDVFG